MKKIIFVFLIVFLVCAHSISAQSKASKPKKPATKVASKTTTKKPSATVETPVETAVKKNERPISEENTRETEPARKANQTTKTNARPASDDKATTPVYFYTFSQPQFLVSKILIEHDENGKGKISFQKRDFGELITDPLELSPATLERVKAIYNTLNFLESKENYQSPERSYAHLGTMTFAVKKDEKARTAEFNWTENKDAKLLADEYRRIGQQFVWIFDINIARQNQPLETPSLVDALDSMIKRNEIADAVQMLPFLTELSADERLPLIARNHAARIVKEIEKKAKK